MVIDMKQQKEKLKLHYDSKLSKIEKKNKNTISLYSKNEAALKAENRKLKTVVERLNSSINLTPLKSPSNFGLKSPK